MMITVLENDADVPSGHLARVAAGCGIGLDVVRLHARESLPDPRAVESVIVLGGEMGAYDIDGFPYLPDEKRFLAQAVALGIPVLGICLGCQLLADALGGSAYLADAVEYHLGPIEIIEPDPVVDVLGAGPSIALHRDTWSLPPGGVLLARTGEFNHAFRLGSALGVQPHPEVTSETLASWLSTPEGEALAGAAGTDAGRVLSDFVEIEVETKVLADRFFRAWFDEVGANC